MPIAITIAAPIFIRISILSVFTSIQANISFSVSKNEIKADQRWQKKGHSNEWPKEPFKRATLG